MREPISCTLHLEELEPRDLTNMPFGQLGTPILGSATLKPHNPSSNSPTVVAFSDRMESRNVAMGESWISTIPVDPKPDVSPLIPAENSQANTPTTSDNNWNHEIASPRPIENEFDPFGQNLIDINFPPESNGPSSLSTSHTDRAGSGSAGISSSTDGQTAPSGSSAAFAGASSGFTASVAGNQTFATSPQSPPMTLFPSGVRSSIALSQKGAPTSIGITPNFSSQPNTFTGFIVLNAPNMCRLMPMTTINPWSPMESLPNATLTSRWT
jgi:hypothetical protein